MATGANPGHAYAPGAGIARGNAFEHVHGWSAQPGHLKPRVRPRPSPVPTPELSRVGSPVYANPFPSAVSVSIADGPGAVVTDVHVAGPDGALKMAGAGPGRYQVPQGGQICPAWLGDDVPAWTWEIIPGDPGDK
jgi:hypothetical protein